jgi:hypothetical protein
MARQRREGRAKSRVGLLTPLEMMNDPAIGDRAHDRAVWEKNRSHWLQGNPGTAPAMFWEFEPCVPEELRDPHYGEHSVPVDQVDAMLTIDDARRAWLMERGGDWRALLDDGAGDE